MARGLLILLILGLAVSLMTYACASRDEDANQQPEQTNETTEVYATTPGATPIEYGSETTHVTPIQYGSETTVERTTEKTLPRTGGGE
jgi:hypothetical protein